MSTNCTPISPVAGAWFVVADDDIAAPASSPPLWRPDVSPSTLILVQGPPYFHAAPLDAVALQELLLDHQDPTGRHVVLADRQGAHYLWLPDPAAAQRPAALVPLDETFDLRLEVARRFYRRLSGPSGGPLSSTLQITPFQQARLIALLHALDFHLAGATPRMIAATLIDATAATMPAREWKSSALRRKANRLITDARRLMNGGYRRLLRGH